MNYLVVFDTREVDYLSPSLGATGLIVVLTAILVGLVRKELDRRAGVIFSWLVPTLVGLCLAVTWISTYREYSSAAAALNEGRAPLWLTAAFRTSKPGPTVRAVRGSAFASRDKCFQYRDSDSDAGFNSPSSRGGPIKPGLPVRVTFVGDTIFKLEVGQ